MMSSTQASGRQTPEMKFCWAKRLRKGRIFLTKDHDIGALVHRDLRPHRGLLLLDDLGDPSAETALVLAALSSHGDQLAASAFFRVGPAGVR